MIALIVIVAIVLILALVVAGSYNSLVDLRNRVQNGWSQIDVQLKQRADLIPNLVETVKGYATHESEVFEAVTQARAKAANLSAGGATVQERSEAENMLSRAIVNVLAVAEAYPSLQANQNFINLQEQLAQLEQKIAYARQFYNDVVMKYNNKIQMFPSNIFAKMFHFTQAQPFSVSSSEREAPKVSFSNPNNGNSNAQPASAQPSAPQFEGPFANNAGTSSANIQTNPSAGSVGNAPFDNGNASGTSVFDPQ